MADHCTCMGGPHAWVDHMHMVDQMMVFKANFQRKFWDSRLYRNLATPDENLAWGACLRPCKALTVRQTIYFFDI